MRTVQSLGGAVERGSALGAVEQGSALGGALQVFDHLL